MKADRTRNMTQGRPMFLLLAFALPLFVGNMFQQAYSLADSVIVGRLVGAGALGAVGATNPVTFLFFSICNGIGSGGGIITAQYFGSGNEQKVKKAIANSACLMLGAALATMLGQFLAGLGCLLYAARTNRYFRLERSHLAPDRQILLGAARVGFPLALQWSLIAVSTTALQSVVNSFGTVTVAAFTATSRIEMLAHQPFGSLGTALSTYAGQNYGAGRMNRVKEGLRDSALLMLLFSLILLGLMQPFGRAMIGAFVSDGAVTDMGVWAVWWTAAITWLISAFFCLMRYVWWRKKTADAAIKV